ncbi:MAG: aldo/keto reductase [Planctomycetes bacterium]|nr:aldo/keto reductase [Planctomycetota bacterium]
MPNIPRRKLGRTGVELSIVGMGGIVVSDTEQSFANRTVAQAVARGVNYFDVAPTYGNAEERLGPALEPYRQDVFLACKTTKRDKASAAAELDASLQRLRTDHVDLYQFHALTEMKDLDRVLGPGGAMEAFLEARKAGKIRFIGFSAHSSETALAALDRFAFDTILFPINYVLFTQANFGPAVLAKALEKGVGILALKAMARTTWPASIKKSAHPNPKCWYQPCAMPEEAALALRWTLAHPVTAALPPGDETYFPFALDVAERFQPLDPNEEQALRAQAAGLDPIMRLAHA